MKTETIVERVEQLLDELTLKEKLSMMDGDAPFWPGLADMTGGGYADHPWVAGAVPRLDIDGIRFADGPRGVVLDGATTFPVTIARGAAWDLELEERIGEVIGREIRALGANFFGGVCINLLRHPAWGRAQETYGEDPAHVGLLGAALARGVERHAMACVKHFAVNSMENARFALDVQIDDRALHEMYLPHFKRAVDAGASAVMSAYNSVNGEWCGQNKVLLTEILKERWGFEGFVISDFIFGMRDAEKAANAGMDIEMPFQMLFHGRLEDLVEAGRVPRERINDAVRPILNKQLRLPPTSEYDASMAGTDEHRAIARESAVKSIVMLQNRRGVLPLGGFSRLAVIGRLADAPNTGDTASSSTRPAHVVTPLEGIRAALDNSDAVVFDDGSDSARAVEVARTSDAVLLVVGYTAEDEGEFIDSNTIRNLSTLFPDPAPEETQLANTFMKGLTGENVGSFPTGGDRESLSLRPDDEALIHAVAAVNDRVVVAVVAGSAVVMESWSDRVQGILMLWYPGMEGGHALADVVLGRVCPSGKLPIVIPKRESDLPAFDKHATTFRYDLWHGYRKLDRDGIEPAFPFGFGLSYTTFEYAGMTVQNENVAADEVLRIDVRVSNSGLWESDEIVQIYASPLGSSVERAPRSLLAFSRVSLDAGASTVVHFDIPVVDLAYYDTELQAFNVEAIEYELVAAAHSMDETGPRLRIRVRD